MVHHGLLEILECLTMVNYVQPCSTTVVILIIFSAVVYHGQP